MAKSAANKANTIFPIMPQPAIVLDIQLRLADHNMIARYSTTNMIVAMIDPALAFFGGGAGTFTFTSLSPNLSYTRFARKYSNIYD